MNALKDIFAKLKLKLELDTSVNGRVNSPFGKGFIFEN